MALILAIEPDRKQAGRITLLTRGLPGAELVLADSTEQALAALHGRVPNLILTSLLLSPKDETGLRALNGSGLPVPTLMIPVFATTALRANERSGFLARLPWSRVGAASAAPGTTGCDPAVFASQIWEYLQSSAPEDEASEEAVEAEDDAIEETVENVEQEEVQQDPSRCAALAGSEPEESDWDAVAIDDDEPTATIELSGETIDLHAFMEELEAAELEFAMPQIAKLEAMESDLVDEPVIDDFVIAESVIAAAEPAVEENEPAAPVAAGLDEPVIEESDLASMAAVIDAIPRVTVAHALPGHAPWPPLEGLFAEELSPEELLAIVADFEAVLEDEPENPGNVDADGDLWMPLSVGGTMTWPRLENACSRPKARQDEWGFFDPEQCGLSALIAKLDQVAK